MPKLDPEMPSSIGPFRIAGALGRGAMGVVYLGERIEQFQQRVAIKMLHPHVSLLMGEDALHHEEKVLTSLDHTAIVRLLDTGEHTRGEHYIVMEYVDGIPIDVYCHEKALTRDQRLMLLTQIARAVDFAHRRLVIHADLKPENILVTPEGQPRLLDFGVAVLIDAKANAAASERYTPAFASPEQRNHARVTAATDIYSLGQITRALLTEPASAPLSKDLQAILSKATHVAWDRRYTTMQAFAEDLEAVLESRPVIARNGNRIYRLGKWMQHRRATAAMLLVLTAVLLMSVTGVAIQTARAAQQRRIAQTRLHDLVRLTGVLEGELYDSVNPLPQSTQAKRALISGARETLDSLATDESKDEILTLQLAQQYEKLARLQAVQRDPAAVAQAREDVEKAVTVLRHIPRSNAAYALAQQENADLMLLMQTMPGR